MDTLSILLYLSSTHFHSEIHSKTLPLPSIPSQPSWPSLPPHLEHHRQMVGHAHVLHHPGGDGMQALRAEEEIECHIWMRRGKGRMVRVDDVKIAGLGKSREL